MYKLVKFIGSDFALGFFSGTMVMAVLSFLEFRKTMKKEKSYSTRQHQQIMRMSEALGKYAPLEVIQELLVQSEFHSIATFEENR